MSGLEGRRIVLGVTGGIAAYKAVELARLLTKAGVELQVVMTDAATRFVGPLSFQAVSGKAVRIDLFDEVHEAAMGHIELARWADEIIIAPASADFIARLAHGLADNLLTTICLATAADISVAPAMNQSMWLNVATQSNIRQLENRNVRLLGPASGDQACGETGPGRMLEPEEIMAVLEGASVKGRFSGLSVLISAGPTREAIDPVRFLGNRSSGKMGFAIARAFVAEGADVTLVSGPVDLDAPAGVKRVDVESASEMRNAILPLAEKVDVFVGCAAVADYRPEMIEVQKIKKQHEMLDLRLVRNPDILAEVAALSDGPFTVGFAAETENLKQYAEEKRRVKGVDMIAANLVSNNQGFDAEENALHVLWQGGETELVKQNKGLLAMKLAELIGERYYAD